MNNNSQTYKNNSQTIMERHTYIGSSDVAGILGISPWQTPLDIYLQKVHPEKKQIFSEEKKKIFNRGKRMEPYVLDILSEEENLKIVAKNERYIHPKYNFLSCEIDAEYYDEDLGSIQNIEIKTVNPFKLKEWGEQKTDSIPVHYTAQAMHGLMVTGRETCIFGVLIGVDDFRVYRINRDEETISAIQEKEIEFWGKICNLEAPDPINSSDLLNIFGKDNNNSIEVQGDILSAFNNLRSIKEKIKSLEEEAHEEEEIIKLFMRDYSILTLKDRPIVSWKTQNINRFDQRSFAQKYPDLFSQFKTVSESRIFRIK